MKDMIEPDCSDSNPKFDLRVIVASPIIIYPLSIKTALSGGNFFTKSNSRPLGVNKENDNK